MFSIVAFGAGGAGADGGRIVRGAVTDNTGQTKRFLAFNTN